MDPLSLTARSTLLCIICYYYMGLTMLDTGYINLFGTETVCLMMSLLVLSAVDSREQDAYLISRPRECCAQALNSLVFIMRACTAVKFRQLVCGHEHVF